MLKKWFGKNKDSETPRDESHRDVESPQSDTPQSDAPQSDTAQSDVAQSRSAQPAHVAPDAATPDSPAVEAPRGKKLSAWARLKQGLTKTRQGLSNLFTRRQLDEDFVSELGDQLYQGDFGPSTVDELMKGIREAWKRKEVETTGDVRDYLKNQLKTVLKKRDPALRRAELGTTVILVAGVNGTGKTTSIAKLANRLKNEGHSVVLAAADTFRAAAVEQLTVWSERLGLEIVRGADNADPASVAYKGAEKALEMNADYLIVDTAGRLHTQKNLMKELEKIRNVLTKKIPGAPHESLLVLDATTGQNAVNQAESFTAAADVTGIILTKLDGTARGGIVIAVNNLFEIPVKFIGVGEQVEDLQVFDPDAFVDALLEEEETQAA